MRPGRPSRPFVDPPDIDGPHVDEHAASRASIGANAAKVHRVQVAQSEHLYFASDSIGLRCTWRFGANLVRPDRVGSFTVTDPA